MGNSIRWGALLLVAISPAGGPVHGREIRGVVAGSDGAVASYYRHAQVCADANNDGACGAGEATATTDDNGAFVLTDAGRSPLVADISTHATINSHAVSRHLVLRAPADLPSPLVISPLSTEIARMMEAEGLDERAAQRKLASRIDVAADAVAGDPAAIADARARAALVRESVILTGRFSLAAAMVDRRDLSTIKEAQQAAMNLEAIPRYDHLFVITLENKATSSIVGSPFAPKINAYLKSGNQFTSYFATGNPSEPNRVAVAAGDDFGITDDAPWNCVPAGDTANLPEDPLPAGMPPCINPTNHNIKNKPNLFSAITAAGMTWRVYSESMNPGRDWRLDSAADDAILAPDHVYPDDSPVGAIGTPGLMLRLPASLYATKHNASVTFQAVRSSPDFVRNNRTMGGGQWDAAMKAAPGAPAGWDVDQLGTDLASGDVGTLNFLEPDQCDDMHGVKVQGTTATDSTLQLASDCGKDAIIYRGDNYTDYLIKKIQALAGVEEHQQARRDRDHVRRGERHDRVQLLLRLESERRRARSPAIRSARWSRSGRVRLDRTDRATTPREQGARHQHLRRPHEPAAGAEARRRQRCLQPHLVRADAAGHVRPGRSGRRLVVHEPFEVHRSVHRRHLAHLPEYAEQRRSALRRGASDEPRLS